ncbi:ABC transporter permease [Oceanobacillus arenosus]|uniref:ABC transporter permease n=1 Tax=Oceanobacillus arenosus TaxID=1229153 RepID=A0A3D8PMC6_9BACI|nr:ABC transporter permease [Oceanobacillus arenosus]RDW16295.1 ABC transporter permease [Oceanobacillus arenosus]
MNRIKHIQLFTKSNFMQLKRKWLPLPLLFIFPLLLVGIIAALVITIVLPEENDPIRIGLVDLDKSDETKLVTSLMEESSAISTFIQLHSMTEIQAKIAIENDAISSYLVFPEGFTDSLYTGESVQLPIVGNPNRKIDSFLIQEIIKSVTRHIRSSQANILTINEYAKQLGMDDDTRNELVFEQFKEFVFYTLGSNQILNEKELTNIATSSPIHYFSLAAWFIVLTIWLLTIYRFLSNESPLRMKQRMKLYGVTELQQILAKGFVTLITAVFFAAITFIWLQLFLSFELILEDYVRIIGLLLLYCIAFLIGMAIIETIISAPKVSLFIQLLFTLAILACSGAILPAIYLPLQLQEFIGYSFSYQAFSWISDIILNGRMYADFIPLLLTMLAGYFILLGISMWKERVRS